MADSLILTLGPAMPHARPTFLRGTASQRQLRRHENSMQEARRTLA